MVKIKNLLLDRDGTIIVDKHYLKSPNEVELIPHAGSALQKFSKKGINLFIVTNQSGIGRGYYNVEDFFKVQKRLYDILNSYNVEIKDTEFCPHLPEDKCKCRKPATGMWKKLKKKYHLSEQETGIVGDKICDINFGQRAGLSLKSLVLTGYGISEIKKYSDIKADIIADDLLHLYILLEQEGLI
ncbi:hypothetical protein JCM13304A_19840 [Desulfothermus okinawensis JCM 13304]